VNLKFVSKQYPKKLIFLELNEGTQLPVSEKKLQNTK
jgi:hypothetical protein